MKTKLKYLWEYDHILLLRVSLVNHLTWIWSSPPAYQKLNLCFNLMTRPPNRSNTNTRYRFNLHEHFKTMNLYLFWVMFLCSSPIKFVFVLYPSIFPNRSNRSLISINIAAAQYCIILFDIKLIRHQHQEIIIWVFATDKNQQRNTHWRFFWSILLLHSGLCSKCRDWYYLQLKHKKPNAVTTTENRKNCILTGWLYY